MSTVVEPSVEPAEPTAAPRRRLWLRWVVIVVCVAIAGMWAYVFLFRPTTIYDDVYVMKTPGWQAQAKAICDDATTRRVALSDMGGGLITDPTPEQMRQRADLVDQATDILEQMVKDLVAIPVDNADDAGRMAKLDEFYGKVISDRRIYAAHLRDGEMEPYRESEAAGGPVSNVVSDFTSANGIPRCAPPGELANG